MSARPIDRFLNVFSRVRPGEGVPVIVLLVDLFLILTAYYLLKVVREPLILLGGGAEVKSYAAAGQAVLLILLVPAYGWFASRVPRMTLVNVVTAVFVASFVLFWSLYQADAPIGVPFFLWLGIFNMLVIAQFWSLANELFSPSQGKRLFPIIAVGGTVGAIAGSWLAKELIAPLGIGNLMLLAAALLAACIGLTVIGARAARRAPREADAEETDHSVPLAKHGGFAMVLRVRYLRLIALMIVVYNLVNTTGEYILGSVVTDTATAQAAGNKELAKQLVGQFYGDFFTWVNAVAAILQALVVSRVVRYVGIRVGLLILPAIALGGYGLIATVPILVWIKVAKVTENSVDYSLHNTLRQMLWLPTSPEAKYKAKAAVDTFFVRFGDVLAAGVVWIGSGLALSPRMFAVVNVGAVVIWLALAYAVGRAHDREPRAAVAPEREPEPERPRKSASYEHAPA
ncbi:MAG TPA: Npt1/Npt2 family nucleotide transporter [Kofleriaceae bacterium]|nr:Npt1/Npt2 family nucleotide transporter [Kofleriaceae bacterium]